VRRLRHHHRHREHPQQRVDQADREEFSGDGRFSIGDRAADRAVLEDQDSGQEWAAGLEVREDLGHGVRCIRRGLRRVVQVDRERGRVWARVQDLGRDQDLGRGRAWAERLRCHLRVKRRVRHVQGREGAEDRVTRRAKKAR
jgi:hypothetical protein